LQTPDGRTNNQINHVVVDGRHVTSIMDVRTCRGEDCDLDHHLVQIKYQQHYQSAKIHTVEDKGSMMLKS
jgi:hypothetical protein